VTTEPVALVNEVLTKESGAADVAIAPAGTLVYVAGNLQESLRRVVWLQPDGTSSILPLDPRVYEQARLSPDGQRIAVLVRERGSSGLWVYDVARDAFTRLTAREESVDSPIWSPDGRRLVFWSDNDRGLFTIAVDGSNRSERLATVETGSLYPTAWSPDGAVIAFIQERPSLNSFTVSIQPPHVVKPLATGTGAHVEARYSPNGRWLAHIAFDGGTPEVVVGPAEGRRWWPIAPTGRYPAWTSDSRGVLYVESNAIYRVTIDPDTGVPLGKPTKVLDLPPAIAGRPIELSPDGRRYLMLQRIDANNRRVEIRAVLNFTEEVRAKMAGAAPASSRPQ
jgi:Tol biopolymer transport system component